MLYSTQLLRKVIFSLLTMILVLYILSIMIFYEWSSFKITRILMNIYMTFSVLSFILAFLYKLLINCNKLCPSAYYLICIKYTFLPIWCSNDYRTGLYCLFFWLLSSCPLLLSWMPDCIFADVALMMTLDMSNELVASQSYRFEHLW